MLFRSQIGIVVAVLMKEKDNLVKWVTDVLAKASDERGAWEAEAEARRDLAKEDAHNAGEDVTAIPEIEIPKPSYITIRPIDSETQTALFKNARLKLLMKLVGFEIQGEDAPDVTWIVPAHLTSAQLGGCKSMIEEYMQTPWKPSREDESPEDLLRRVRQPQQRAVGDDGEEEAPRDAFIDDSEGADDLDESAFLFPDNIRSKPQKKNLVQELKAKRQKRKRDEDSSEVDEELAEERRKKRKAAAIERRMKFKSDLYIKDSDDGTDEEKDEEFFRREEETRRRQDERIKKMLMVGRTEEDRKNGQKATKEQNKIVEDGSDEEDVHMLGHDEGGKEQETASSQTTQHSDSENNELDDEDTPMSSQSEGADGTTGRKALEQLRQARSRPGGETKQAASMGDQSADEEEAIVSTARRRVRAGFIMDSDDDE